MENVLIIGLDNLSEKIILNLKTANYRINGFDFEIDKIELYNKNSLIENSPKILLDDLLKYTDIIILNTSYSKYKNIFKLSPFINNDSLIINTNTSKNNLEDIRDILGNKNTNFIPCNFLLFPDNVIINYDRSSKMNTIKKLSNFFNSLSVKTSVLEPKDNDIIFCNLYHIPLLLEKVLLRTKENSLIFDSIKYDYFYEDVLLNKKLILENLMKIFNFLDSVNFDITDLLKEKIPQKQITESNNIQVENSIFEKIIIEKIIIEILLNNNFKNYLSNIFQFSCNQYNFENLNNYYLTNKESVEVNIIMIKEKIYNLISFLKMEEMTANKLTKYLSL